MSNKVALVTGGATGIGKATAKKLLEQGITVVISGRGEEAGAATVREIKAGSGTHQDIHYLRSDVTEESSVRALVAHVVAEFGRLDIGVNCAGIYNEHATIDQSDTDKFRAVIEVNVIGVYLAMKYEIEQMRKQGSGAIVNVASVAGLSGLRSTATYVATKHAVAGMTKAAALDHAAEGLRINAVAPGVIRTKFVGDQLERNEAGLAAMHPMGRIGTPDEVANGIAWLISEEAAFVAGHILCIDGGFEAQ